MKPYIIISYNNNEEYSYWVPNIISRIKSLGFRVVEYLIDQEAQFNGFQVTQTDEGDYYITSGTIRLDRSLRESYECYFFRYLICGLPQFINEVMVIGESDFMPINPNSILHPMYEVDSLKLAKQGKLVSTFTYTKGGLSHASWKIAKGSVLNLAGCGELTTDPEKQAQSVLEFQYKTGRIYKPDEEFTEYNLKKLGLKEVKCDIYGDLNEMQIMRPHQIKYLDTWEDLIPFSNLHAIKKSYMTQEDWDRLDELFVEYDKRDIKSPGYFLPTLDL